MEPKQALMGIFYGSVEETITFSFLITYFLAEYSNIYLHLFDIINMDRVPSFDHVDTNLPHLHILHEDKLKKFQENI